MISVQQALSIHKTAIEKFGGSEGISHRGSLESSLSRPFQTFDGVRSLCQY